jgi:glutamyl-tRNA synthetase
MGITHVVRGEDLVNTTPRVLLLREAMGATSHPVYAHLPLSVNEKRQKLSKRRDDVAVGECPPRTERPCECTP